MPDLPISALSQIGRYPLPAGSLNPTTGDMLEVLDTTNTSMAPTGTNSRIAPGDLIFQTLAAGTNISITETSGIVTIAASGGGGMAVGNAVSGGSNHATLVEDGSGNLAALAIGSAGQVLTVVSGSPAWAAASGGGGMAVGNAVSGGSNYATLVEDGSGYLAALAIGSAGQVLTVTAGAPNWAAPVTATFLTSLLSSTYTLTTTSSAIGLSISIATAGTYLITGMLRVQLVGSSPNPGDEIYAIGSLYAGGIAITNSETLLVVGTLQAASVTANFQQSSPLSFIYTASGSTTLAVYAKYALTGSATSSSAGI